MDQFQRHVKTLIENLFMLRVEKARAAGSNITNIFEGSDIIQDDESMKKHRHLELACMLELCSLLCGIEYGGQTFTEMYYLANDS